MKFLQPELDLYFSNETAKIYIDPKHELIYSRWFKGTLDEEWWEASNAVYEASRDSGFDAYISDAHQGVMIGEAVAEAIATKVMPQLLETNVRILVSIIPQEIALEMAMQMVINVFPPPFHGNFCYSLPDAIAWITEKRQHMSPQICAE